ncbi:MAG: RluA family pseudouridine synthase [Acholeplasmatales bacterium]|nr:RluA family pseudouridine synthase [Acholeplasmatales bacterium]
MKLFKVDEANQNIRLDKALKNLIPDKSRAYLSKCIDEEKVLLNGSKCKPSDTVRLGDEISLLDIEPKPLEIKASDLNLDIIYEDDCVAIVNKPKNMVVHPANGNYDNTLVNGLLHELDDLSEINGVIRPGIVHRIDKDTTGLLMIAKNDIACQSLTEQLKEHSVKRRYHALVHGVINESKGRINAPIGRDKNDRKKMAVVKDGKEAITNFTVIKRFKEYTYIECALETGRTHQIRVHMQYINHPIVGDQSYGRRKYIGDQGQFLHAKIIGFVHPQTKQWVEFDSQLPQYFTDFMNELE